MVNPIGVVLAGKKVGQALLKKFKPQKVAGAIKSVAPSVKPTGTKSLIGKYKKAIEKVKSTPEVIEKKTKAVKEIHKFVKKHGGSKTDEVVGAHIKGKK